jgi:hypothetical protein
MKTGKKIPIIVDPTFKSHIGTVDSLALKSLYIQFSSWVEPVNESKCWECVVKSFKKSIKSGMSEIMDTTQFKPKLIVDLDLRSSGLNLSKRSFMKCEITLFTKTHLRLKDKNLVSSLKEKTRLLINKEKSSNKHFSFYSTKTH